MSGSASELARRLAREAEAVCRYYLSNGRRQGALLARRRCPQHAGPIDVRAAQGDRARGRPANGPTPPAASMAICSTSSAKAAASSISRTSPKKRVVPQPAASAPEPHADALVVVQVRRADRIVRGGATPVRHVAADRAHSRRSVSAPTRHYGFARNRQSALPPALLLPARRA